MERQPERFWYCRTCGVNARIDRWPSPLGERYMCQGCGRGGRMVDEDAPVHISEEQHDRWWRELQSDPTFRPPSE